MGAARTDTGSGDREGQGRNTVSVQDTNSIITVKVKAPQSLYVCKKKSNITKNSGRDQDERQAS